MTRLELLELIQTNYHQLYCRNILKNILNIARNHNFTTVALNQKTMMLHNDVLAIQGVLEEELLTGQSCELTCDVLSGQACELHIETVDVVEETITLTEEPLQSVENWANKTYLTYEFCVMPHYGVDSHITYSLYCNNRLVKDRMHTMEAVREAVVYAVYEWMPYLNLGLSVKVPTWVDYSLYNAPEIVLEEAPVPPEVQDQAKSLGFTVEVLEANKYRLTKTGSATVTVSSLTRLVTYLTAVTPCYPVTNEITKRMTNKQTTEELGAKKDDRISVLQA